MFVVALAVVLAVWVEVLVPAVHAAAAAVGPEQPLKVGRLYRENEDNVSLAAGK